MEVRLVVERGGPRQSFRVSRPRVVVGRGRGCAIRIPSEEVSRRHCRLRLENDVVTVQDLDSSNGTLLNGVVIEGIEIVRPGDRLEIGPVTFMVKYALTPEVRARLKEEEESDVDVDLVLDGEESAIEDIEEIEDEDETGDEKEVAEPEEEEEEEEVKNKSDFEFGEAWRPPDSGELRDILAQLEDDGPKKKDGKKGKKTKKKKED
jgi:pSer/pThr/pTyr-binding forkhead associated (FHA) protein